MRGGLTLLMAIATAIAGASVPGLGQTNHTNEEALAACVQAADQKYKDTWEAVCARLGNESRCFEFMGSPRDKAFSQLRIDEMTLCAKLYRR